jgi:hypothetical protein
VTCMGCEFRRTKSQKTEAERHGRNRSDLRHLIRAEVGQVKGICLAFMASGSSPGNGPVLDPAKKHTSRS